MLNVVQIKLISLINVDYLGPEDDKEQLDRYILSTIGFILLNMK